MKHLNTENPCNLCEGYKPCYIIVHNSEYDRCTKIKSFYSKIDGFCDIERNPYYDDLTSTQCGSRGKYFTPSSKKERILKHIKGFFFGTNSIIILILIVSFLPLIIALF